MANLQYLAMTKFIIQEGIRSRLKSGDKFWHKISISVFPSSNNVNTEIQELEFYMLFCMVVNLGLLPWHNEVDWVYLTMRTKSGIKQQKSGKQFIIKFIIHTVHQPCKTRQGGGNMYKGQTLLGWNLVCSNQSVIGGGGDKRVVFWFRMLKILGLKVQNSLIVMDGRMP